MLAIVLLQEVVALNVSPPRLVRNSPAGFGSRRRYLCHLQHEAVRTEPWKALLLVL